MAGPAGTVERSVDGRSIRLVKGDIAQTQADVLVNAANESLAPGAGVSGAIHRAGGPAIWQECQKIGGCRTGDAVVTTAGRLPAHHVVHAVAPIWRGGNSGEQELLARAYRRSLEVAESVGARTVAFPSLGTGIYGYPVDRAASTALRAVVDGLRLAGTVHEVTFVLFSSADLLAYSSELETLA